MLFIYLFSNDLASISGLYRIPGRVMRNETGLPEETVRPALEKFCATEKIFYEDGTMWVVNMFLYHRNASK